MGTSTIGLAKVLTWSICKGSFVLNYRFRDLSSRLSDLGMLACELIKETTGMTACLFLRTEDEQICDCQS